MKFIRYCTPLLVLLVACQLTLAQTDASVWGRVQTDNGEFSVEVPADHSYFFNGPGFYVSAGSRDFSLRDVSILNAYVNGTLVSFEVYRGDSDAMTALIDTASSRSERVGTTKLNDTIEAKELVRKTDTHYFASYYFRSKGFVYVVSAGSRKGETAEMKRFFDSVKLMPGSKVAAPDAVPLSKLKRVSVNIKTEDVKPMSKGQPKSAPPPDPVPSDESTLLISRPRASYTASARAANVQGGVRLRVHLAPNGFVTNLETIKPLPEGLTRQAIFAALRLKYLPKLKDDQPVMSIRIIEYTFSIF